jgi:hypothetical protein
MQENKLKEGVRLTLIVATLGFSVTFKDFIFLISRSFLSAIRSSHQPLPTSFRERPLLLPITPLKATISLTSPPGHQCPKSKVNFGWSKEAMWK